MKDKFEIEQQILILRLLDEQYAKDFPFTLKSTPFRQKLYDLIRSLEQDIEKINIEKELSNQAFIRMAKVIHKPTEKIPAYQIKDFGYCEYCEEKLDKDNFSRDHIHPRSLGGEKLVSCCKRCNNEKAAMPLAIWITYCNYRLGDYKVNSEEYRRYNQISLNANKLAKELSL